MGEAKRIRLAIEGIVQGVGFRPFVYRLATAHSLGGWVRNTPAGVLIEVEGPPASIELFRDTILMEPPPLAVVNTVECTEVAASGAATFTILESGEGAARAVIPPDSHVCPECLKELFDLTDRRYRYPFINCTNCGPRYSIITAIPYDRPFTTMAGFPMCDSCRKEYKDPLNRRFHAQPNACPDCGPQLQLLATNGSEMEKCGETSLLKSIALLREGKIIAVKGTGGYHLAVDACNSDAVAELRRRKQRDEKPFALLVSGLSAVRLLADTNATEQRLLESPERPIVLVRKRSGHGIADGVAPANGYFGIMLPSNPLQHLLVENFQALVMTSGNLSDEPIAYRDDEALHRLAGIADGFLVHNREIYCRSDDSVLRVYKEGPLLLRRARGYVPRGVAIPKLERSVLAVGGELKGTICLTRGSQAHLSQHLGDLKNSATLDSMGEAVFHLRALLQIEPEIVAHDLHPDYLSTGFAADYKGVPRMAVQHHHAHMASCMAENGLQGEVIGIIFDGSGYGSDGTVWGGEFLVGGYRSFARVGHIMPLPLLGGDAAVKEPFRMALAWLHKIYGDSLFDHALPATAMVADSERPLFLRMLATGLMSPPTSSCGRLFDAVAALLDVRQVNSYEGQAAIELEALAERSGPCGSYPYLISTGSRGSKLDLRLLVEALMKDIAAGEAREKMARRFHTTLALGSADICDRLRRKHDINRVVLSGGVFQNRLLTEELHAILCDRGFQVYVHRLVPPNDGGISLGQAMVAGQSAIT
jgi:hydrogenase maturation protein HypF